MTNKTKVDGCTTVVAVSDEVVYGDCNELDAATWYEQCFKTFNDPVLSLEEIDSPDRCSGGRTSSSVVKYEESNLFSARSILI